MGRTAFILLCMLLLTFGCSNDEHDRKIVEKWKGEKTGIVAELLSDGTLIFNDQPGQYQGVPIKKNGNISTKTKFFSSMKVVVTVPL
jgi:hypothetical protein